MYVSILVYSDILGFLRGSVSDYLASPHTIVWLDYALL